MFFMFCTILILFKIMLYKSYKSTDFEVHRNWLAITHNLSIDKWYTEDTSNWTLDYPPFFAYLELLLSYFAQLIDPEMLVISNLYYSSTATLLFQRLSVISLDCIFLYSCKRFCDRSFGPINNDWFTSKHFAIFFILTTNFGLIIIDHIHFQYNGFLFGILILSILRIQQHRNIEAAVLFTILLNFKHIFLYLAPAYFIYLLRSYCFQTHKKEQGISWSSFSPIRFLGLAFSVIFICGISFGPFIQKGLIAQVFSRLFPFKRGLCHAYWAPNLWALYNSLDIGLKFVFKPVVLNITSASMTGGLVQEFNHSFLPSVSPISTMILTVISLLPCLIKYWIHPSGTSGFVRLLVLSAFGSFLFGWHVHEKAILIIIIPLTLLIMEKHQDSKVFLILSIAGHYSLFPLIFTPQENAIKYSIFLCYSFAAFILINYSLRKKYGECKDLLKDVEKLYLVGFLPLELYCSCLHAFFGLDAKLPFVPLMLTSVYCSIGVIYSWIIYYHFVLTN